jgi:outer membrane protein assembly factor BamB
MHRSLSSPAIRNDLLFIPDQSGVVHCLDAQTGAAHWTHDMEAASWSTPLIAGDTVCIANNDGVLLLFALSAQKKVLAELSLDGPIYNTPVVAEDVLYVATFQKLYAIADGNATRPVSEGSK